MPALPSTAQVPFGSGALDAITGTVTSPSDADMYRICLTGGGTFSASLGLPDGFQGFDAQLYLFDSSGNGVYANDDNGRILGPSLLPAGHPLTPADPGTYYLAISAFDNDPVSVGGEIFPDTFTAVAGPTGPGGGSSITDWTDTGDREALTPSRSREPSSVGEPVVNPFDVEMLEPGKYRAYKKYKPPFLGFRQVSVAFSEPQIGLW